MPNWCMNDATITATTEKAKELLKRYKHFLSDGPMKNDFFGWFVPPPEGQKNFLSWANENWGSKWDVDMTLDSIAGDTISFTEDTAWSPPIEFYNAMVNLGFDVEAAYYEPGCKFFGRYKNGEDDCIEIPNPSKEWKYLKLAIKNPRFTIQLGPEFQISDLKPGDHLTKDNKNLAIYADHKLVLWEDIKQDNHIFFDSTLQKYDAYIQDVCEMGQDFYLFEVVRNTAKIGAEKAVMFIGSNELIFFDR